MTHCWLQLPDCDARAIAPATGLPGTTRGSRKLTVIATHAASRYTRMRRARAAMLAPVPRGGAAAALADDQLDGQDDVGLRPARVDLRVEDLERSRAELLHRLPHGRQRRVEVARDGHVVEAGDRDVPRHAEAAPRQRVHSAERRLVVRAEDRARQLPAGVDE